MAALTPTLPTPPTPANGPAGIRFTLWQEGRREVRICAGGEALSRLGAELFADAVDEARARSGRCAVALSGGNTPRALLRLLADPTSPFRLHIPWQEVHLFWGDERHVPPTHTDSNYRMVRETLLRSVPIPAENVHRIAAELPDAAEAAERYEAELRAFFAPAPAAVDDTPRFDLVLLGLGDDTHTASLFPGGEAVRETGRLVVAPYVAAHDGYRITLTPKVLNAALQAVFLVSGASKAPAVRTVLEGPRDPDRHPAQIVDAERTLWLLDRAAASALRT